MAKLSSEDKKKKLDAASAASEIYVESMYSLLQCFDLSIPDESSRAHGILNMIEQIQKVHSALENPAPSREERVDAFKRR